MEYSFTDTSQTKFINTGIFFFIVHDHFQPILKYIFTSADKIFPKGFIVPFWVLRFWGSFSKCVFLSEFIYFIGFHQMTIGIE